MTDTFPQHRALCIIILMCLLMCLSVRHSFAQDSIQISSQVINNQSQRQPDIVLNSPTETPLNKPSGSMLFFYRLGRIIETFLMKGIDSTYLQLYNRSWKLAFTTNVTGIHSKLNLSNLPYYSETGALTQYDEVIKLQSAPSVGMGFAAAWHTIQFNYSWDILYRRSSKFDFAILNRAWGIEFMRHVYTNIYGPVSDAQSDNYPIQKGDIQVATSFLSAYFIFNSEKYSTYSALRQSYIQKKSAGSLYLQAQYLGSHITALNPELIERMNYLNDIELHQAAISAGYGYNYTPNQGKFLLHISAAPMAILFNRTILTYTYSFINEETKQEDSFKINKIIAPKHWFYLTGTARVAFSWDINEWCYLAGNAQFYNLRFNSVKDDDLQMKINTWEWNANLSFGARFGFSRNKMRKVLEQYDAEKALNPGKGDILDWVEKLINKH